MTTPKRRGHSYATILIDMDTRRPLDILEDRQSATLAQWLKDHPGVQVAAATIALADPATDEAVTEDLALIGAADEVAAEATKEARARTRAASIAGSLRPRFCVTSRSRCRSGSSPTSWASPGPRPRSEQSACTGDSACTTGKTIPSRDIASAVMRQQKSSHPSPAPGRRRGRAKRPGTSNRLLPHELTHP